MKLFKNQWTNIILGIAILAMLIPQTRKPIQIFANKLLSFSPTITEEGDRPKLANYNWVLENSNGKRVEFANFKGEVIIVNFWATWCPPCIAEMPSFQELYEDYSGNVRFLFVSNEEHETVTNYIKQKRFSLPTYKMRTQAPAPMLGKTLPTTYVINKNGDIVVEKTGAANWNSETFRKTLDNLIKS